MRLSILPMFSTKTKILPDYYFRWPLYCPVHGGSHGAGGPGLAMITNVRFPHKSLNHSVEYKQPEPRPYLYHIPNLKYISFIIYLSFIIYHFVHGWVNWGSQFKWGQKVSGLFQLFFSLNYLAPSTFGASSTFGAPSTFWVPSTFCWGSWKKMMGAQKVEGAQKVAGGAKVEGAQNVEGTK